LTTRNALHGSSTRTEQQLPDVATPGSEPTLSARGFGRPPAILCSVAGSRNDPKAEDWVAPEAGDLDVAPPPYTPPSWTDTDLEEILEPAQVGDPAMPEGGSDEAPLASYVELAMKNLQHHRAPVGLDHDEASFYGFGSGDSSVYAIEDGVDRLMIGRGVGRDGEGCIYCLVASSSPAMLAMLDRGDVSPIEVFDYATELTLCSVFRADQITNVILVQRYKTIEDVPVEYRPGQPFLRFSED
jgi:hypothetical protein